MEEVETCKLKYRPNTKKRKSSAFVAQFANGRISSDKINFSVFSKRSTGPDQKVIPKLLVGSTKRLDYVGSNLGVADSPHAQLNKFSLCVLNKRTGKMKIYDTDLFHCKPLLETQIQKSEEKDLTYSEKLDSLTSSFGSKMKQRAMLSKQVYKVEAGSTEKRLLATANTIVKTESSSSNASTERSIFLIPPKNMDAKTSAEVYNLDDIINKADYLELHGKASEMEQATSEEIADWKKSSKYCNYVFHYLQKKKSDSVTLHNCRLLAYYDYVAKFYKLGYQDLRKKDPAPDIPNPLKSSFLNHFVVKDGRSRSMPLRMKDKLLAHALVVALFLDEFHVDMAVFQTDFKLTGTKVTKLAYAVGCHVLNRKTSDETTRIAVLKLPLYVPRETVSKRKNPKN